MECDRPFRIVFMGTPEFAVPALNALLKGPDQVVSVVSQPDRPRGRGRKLLPTPVKSVAEAADIPVLQPESVKKPEFLDVVRGLEPDLLVVAAFGQILPGALLAIPRIMPINIHGSLLPRYRGAAPIQWALMEGEAETGITIMRMDEGMDTGPMLLKGSIEIGPEETFGHLYRRMASLGGRLIIEALEQLHAGTLKEIPQPETGVTYAPPIKKEMARIDWGLTARKLHCLIRAFDPLPGAFTFWGDMRLRIYRPTVMETVEVGNALPGTVIDVSESSVVVATGQGALGIGELQAPGKRRLSCAEFLRGRPIKTGEQFA